MKRYLIAIILTLCVVSVYADIEIRVRKNATPATLQEMQMDGVAYVGVSQLGSVLKCIPRQDREDQRLYLHFNGESFIFLEGSSYYNFKLNSFNMHYPLKRSGVEYYIPSIFIKENLPLHFPGNILCKGNRLELDKPFNRNVQVIVLDPGHGGKDPGAVGKVQKAQEKEVNLGVALKLKQLLENEMGITVLMTRSDDRFVSLGERTRYANDHKADLFVSIHTNSSKDSKAKGTETYYLSTAVTSDARAVEALENQVVELYEGGVSAKAKYDDLGFILSDLSQTEHLESSNDLAGNIQMNLIAGSGRYDRGVKQANFYVLRGAFMPAVLIELGFISNPEEEKLLTNPDYQQRLARTIFEGIKRFKYRYDRIRNT